MKKQPKTPEQIAKKFKVEELGMKISEIFDDEEMIRFNAMLNNDIAFVEFLALIRKEARKRYGPKL